MWYQMENQITLNKAFAIKYNMHKRPRQPDLRHEQGPVPAKQFHGFHDAALPDPLIGATIDDRYTIQRKIGSGGTASVYAAKDAKKGNVAIKIASPRLDLSLMNRLIENEYSILSKLRHDNIVRALANGRIGERGFLVLEHLEGRTLFESVDLGRRLSWGRGRSFLIQLCDGLEKLHSLGLVHGDVKAGNVFITDIPEGERVKLLDFGMSRRPSDAELAPSHMAQGTPTYMAPEVILKDGYDNRSDIYSVGVLMYKMLCGVAPFCGSAKDVLLMHISTEPVAPRDFHPYLDIPHSLEDIVLKALEKDPDRRFQDIASMRQAIIECTFWPKEIGLIDGMDWGRILKLA
jgi:eukaryotic-like serine/threonine-protein kinase